MRNNKYYIKISIEIRPDPLDTTMNLVIKFKDENEPKSKMRFLGGVGGMREKNLEEFGMDHIKGVIEKKLRELYKIK